MSTPPSSARLRRLLAALVSALLLVGATACATSEDSEGSGDTESQEQGESGGGESGENGDSGGEQDGDGDGGEDDSG